MEIDYKIIGQRIKEARKNKGWSQEMLSEEIDVAVGYISRIERGRGSKVTLRRLVQISNVLGVELSYLITGTVEGDKRYLDKELYETLTKCTPAKQRLIYNIATIVSNSKVV